MTYSFIHLVSADSTGVALYDYEPEVANEKVEEAFDAETIDEYDEDKPVAGPTATEP